jgi:glycerophosphoryl diester phosphodiesterase
VSLDPAFLLIGHRGAAGLEPENTLRSFARAIALGVDAIELDVYALGDRIVVIHDDTLDRTTDGRGPIAGRSFQDLRALDAGKGERIPLLEEVLDVVAGRVAVNVELKGRGTARAVARTIAHRPDTAFLVSSFDHRELAAFRTTTRSVPVAPLFDRNHARMFDIADGLGAWSVNVSRRIASPALIDAAHSRGYGVLVYTVNDPEEAIRLARNGARGVFTDYPDRVRGPT